MGNHQLIRSIRFLKTVFVVSHGQFAGRPTPKATSSRSSSKVLLDERHREFGEAVISTTHSGCNTAFNAERVHLCLQHLAEARMVDANSLTCDLGIHVTGIHQQCRNVILAEMRQSRHFPQRAGTSRRAVRRDCRSQLRTTAATPDVCRCPFRGNKSRMNRGS